MNHNGKNNTNECQSHVELYLDGLIFVCIMRIWQRSTSTELYPSYYDKACCFSQQERSIFWNSAAVQPYLDTQLAEGVVWQVFEQKTRTSGDPMVFEEYLYGSRTPDVPGKYAERVNDSIRRMSGLVLQMPRQRASNSVESRPLRPRERRLSRLTLPIRTYR
jgi:hypothetical protein